MRDSSEKEKTVQNLEDIYRQMIVGEPAVRPAGQAIVADQENAQAPEVSLTDGLTVVISQDVMSAFLVRATGAPVAITEEELLQELARHGVTFGIDHEAVVRAMHLLQTVGCWHEDLLVARGVPPNPGRQPHFSSLQWKTDASGAKVWLSGGEILDFRALRALLNATLLQEPVATCRVKAVLPGEVIATLAPGRAAAPGCNVLGLPVLPEQPCAVGENVRFQAGDGAFLSMLYGYLHIEDNTISVLLPVWVSPDRMSAYFVNLPQVGTPFAPTVAHLTMLLTFKGIPDVCIRSEVLEKLAVRLRRGEKLPVLNEIASGTAPRPGEDAKFTYFFVTEAKAGTLKEGDYFDLRERSLVVSVVENTLLAEKIPAKKGISGADLYGKPFKTTDGKDLLITFNDGVREEKDGEKIRYWSKKTGVVSFRHNRLSVLDLFEVKGDVDYSTGNIDVTSALTITGSVGPGFTVKSGGDMHIRGTVESGATVVSRGDLTVAGGIIGEGTRIVVFGTLRANYIMDASVVAKGDIVVQNYLYNASIRCGGTVTVLKGSDGSGGKIISGTVSAAGGIHASSVGSMSSGNTLLILQNRPEDVLALEKIVAEAKQCAENILKMTRTLQLDSVSPERIKALLAAAPAAKRPVLIRVLQALNQLLKQREPLAAEERDLRERMGRELAEAVIRVTSTVFQGNTVQIGDKKLVVPTDLSSAVFQLKDGVITY